MIHSSGLWKQIFSIAVGFIRQPSLILQKNTRNNPQVFLIGDEGWRASSDLRKLFPKAILKYFMRSYEDIVFSEQALERRFGMVRLRFSMWRQNGAGNSEAASLDAASVPAREIQCSHKTQGFTLTEVLLVSVMFALISLAVYHAFANGFKLWGRGQHAMVEGDMEIFLDRMSEDLRSTVTISTIPFKGNSYDLMFPAIVLAPMDPNSSRGEEVAGPQIGAIRYTFDPGEKKIYRSQAVYGQALKGQWSAPVIVASLIEDLTIRYYFIGDKGLQVKDEMDQGVPMGVLVDIQFITDGETRHMHRFMLVPVGGGI